MVKLTDWAWFTVWFGSTILVVVVSGFWATERNNPNTRPCMLFTGLTYKKTDQ